jgi:acetyltransferase-like isoleucine patch superfamily enzyme
MRQALGRRLWAAQCRLVTSYKGLRLGGIGSNCTIYASVRIYGNRQVCLGDRVTLNDFVHIWGAGGVAIGSGTIIAAGSVITSQTHDLDALQKGILYRETLVLAPVVIGKNVWIGSGAIVLPGVRIGDNSVIGAGAIVTRDVPNDVLAIGTPARTARRLNNDINTPSEQGDNFLAK